MDSATDDEPIDVTSPPKPIWVLDASLEPLAMSVPCPSRAVAHLGFERGVVVPCGGSYGHDGNHRYSIEWRDES